MKIKEFGDKIIEGEKSIFLMGPMSGIDNSKLWYDEALTYLEDSKYDGVVYIPFNNNRSNDALNIWRMKALDNSTVACFWVPRNNSDMLGLDINIYFGKCLGSDKLIYGRPDHTFKSTDLDELYFMNNCEKPYSNLMDLMFSTTKKADKLYSMNKLDVIKYLCDNNPLLFKKIGESLSREERDYIISNLDIEKVCSNCTEYCCGGLNNCSRWNNDDIVGKAKAIKYLK